MNNSFGIIGRQVIKELIWSMSNIHQPASIRPNIAIIASRRSGSTILMEAIAANPGVKFCDQPLSIYSVPCKAIHRIPVFDYGQIVELDGDEAAMVEEYLNDIVQGKLNINTQWRFWKKTHSFQSSRVVLKITDAVGIIDWLEDKLRLAIIILIRHPIAQALSVSYNKWGHIGKALLRKPSFINGFLTVDQASLCKRIYETGSALEQYVLDWALENMKLFHLLQRRTQWIWLSYEDLITHTDEAIHILAEKLDLPSPEKMMQVLKRPSLSTKGLSARDRIGLIQSGDRKALTESWKEKVSESQKEQCFGLLEALGLKRFLDSDGFPKLTSKEMY